ncbi:hypothetical protein BPAE_0240g00100 [Botrytis paeoniae]|uniref:Uncharacterized protein n=1 Tax=Botrytis paeoniae TaxID=278948 RepID=A0A4Z1FEA4_9HELO|nr:hypothetical protein BPAE_0240g00100 [Botrytis paeoniae]
MAFSTSRNTKRRRQMDPVPVPQIPSIQRTRSTNTSRSDGLYKFPVKVRAIIFFYVLCDSWHGKSPNFLKALRGDRLLYSEALPIFYKYNVYEFHRWSLIRPPYELGFLRNVQNLRIIIHLRKLNFSNPMDELEVARERMDLLQAVDRFPPNPSNRLCFSLVNTWPLLGEYPPRFSLGKSINMYVNYSERLRTFRQCFERFRQKLAESPQHESQPAPILSITFEEGHIRRSGLLLDHLLKYFRFYIPMKDQRLATVNSSGPTTWEWETEWRNDLVQQFKSAHSDAKRRGWHSTSTISEIVEKDHDLWIHHCF